MVTECPCPEDYLCDSATNLCMPEPCPANLPALKGKVVKEEVTTEEYPSVISGFFQCEAGAVLPDGRNQINIQCVDGEWKDKDDKEIPSCIAPNTCEVGISINAIKIIEHFH